MEMTLTGGSSAGKKGRCTNGRLGRGCGFYLNPFDSLFLLVRWVKVPVFER